MNPENPFRCCNCRRPSISRRTMLRDTACGFGAVALAAMLDDFGIGQTGASDDDRENAAQPAPHFEPSARNVIFLYMDGGPSQIDTFDPKERLTREHGKPFRMKAEPTQFNDNGLVMQSPWKFNQYGECGLTVSELFPHVARHADKLAVIRSMVAPFSEHAAANYFLHTGSGLQGRPSMGAWFGYGLGSECEDLPGFVVLNGGLVPVGGLSNFHSGFLPASFQASVFQSSPSPISNIHRTEATEQLQIAKRDLTATLDKQFQQQVGRDAEIEAAIANAELAFRMQTSVPGLTDLSDETAATRTAYGLDSRFAGTAIYGRQCLLARRLIERGVRFVELTCPALQGHDRWDQHDNLKRGHTDNALAVDQPIGALLTDLQQRGLLDHTLVVWAGEFGRTPFAQGADGRDHNPYGFSIWLAGGGVRGGVTYGATDEYGYRAIENKVTIHDLHATMLHLLGVDHKRLTFPFSGRDMRLTDVHGNVVSPILRS